ncbi:MAG: hypothetical protein CSA33_03160 [Desulfobulbus propionicus]|nr:MAG: hypothetical protein CSA33_03160 [Desulfobulbus propionicus]
MGFVQTIINAFFHGIKPGWGFFDHTNGKLNNFLCLRGPSSPQCLRLLLGRLIKVFSFRYCSYRRQNKKSLSAFVFFFKEKEKKSFFDPI